MSCSLLEPTSGPEGHRLAGRAATAMTFGTCITFCHAFWPFCPACYVHDLHHAEHLSQSRNMFGNTLHLRAVVELPPITEDDRRVAADAADMVLPKQRPMAEVDEDPSEPLSESPPAESSPIETADVADDSDSKPNVPEGAASADASCSSPKPSGCA